MIDPGTADVLGANAALLVEGAAEASFAASSAVLMDAEACFAASSSAVLMDAEASFAASSAAVMDAQAALAASPVDTFFRDNPISASFIACSTKASCSDAISQRTVAGTKFDARRNTAFYLYGGAYQGVAQHFIYNELFPAMFGAGTEVSTVLMKVLVDQLVLAPFLCLPVAYIVKALVFGQPLRDGLRRYAHDAQRDLLWKYWAIWTPVDCLTFSVIPEHYRIVFIAAVSFFWLIVLSSISNSHHGEMAPPGIRRLAAEVGLSTQPVSARYQAGDELHDKEHRWRGGASIVLVDMLGHRRHLAAAGSRSRMEHAEIAPAAWL